MKLYRREIKAISFGYDDHSSGKVVVDWTPEEKVDLKSIPYEYEIKILERFVEVTMPREEGE